MKDALAKAKSELKCFIMDFLLRVMFTDGARQLCEGIVGEQKVLQALTAADLLVYHLQVVLGNIQVHQLFQHAQHLDKEKKTRNKNTEVSLISHYPRIRLQCCLETEAVD